MCEQGFSLFELVIVVAIISIFLGTAGLEMMKLENKAQNGANELSGFLKRTRAKALATTNAYTITPLSGSSLKTSYATSCSDTNLTDDVDLTLSLPSGAAMTNTSWSICYSTRGLSNTSVDIPISDTEGTATVRVVLGGGIKIIR
jgi:prepilin-type N-terminal cleavage/methylation domain-containing protein